MDTINSNSDMSLCSVQIKEEPLDIEPESEELINSSHEVKEELINPADDVKVELIDPADNVKVELEEEEGVKLETNVPIDPLANVQVHYTEETSSSEPSSSRKRPAPSSSGAGENEDMDIITKHFEGYDELKLIPRNDKFESVRKGCASRLMRRFVCNVCGFSTPYKRNMDSHKKKENGEISKCVKCDYIGINKFDVMIHTKTEHPELYTCDMCSYSSTCKERIKYHVNCSHTTKLLLCTLCDFKTKSQTYLYKHLRSKHPSVKPYECDACDQSFSTPHCLDIHKRKKHNTTKVYFCKICDYSTKKPYELTQHEHSQHMDLVVESLNSDMFI